MHAGYGSGISPVAISPRMRLDDVVKATDDLPFGGTDCALPMLWAAENKVPVDIFCVYTDSETWAGDIHPVQALRAYRQKMGIGAKLVVIGMVSNGFTHRRPERRRHARRRRLRHRDAVGHRRFRNPDVARVMSRRAPVAASPSCSLSPRKRGEGQGEGSGKGPTKWNDRTHP